MAFLCKLSITFGRLPSELIPKLRGRDLSLLMRYSGEYGWNTVDDVVRGMAEHHAKKRGDTADAETIQVGEKTYVPMDPAVLKAQMVARFGDRLKYPDGANGRH